MQTEPTPSTTLDLSNLPSCEDQPDAPACVPVTVPLPADADLIVERYRAFAQKHLEVQANPDSPDWSGLLALVMPDVRQDARAEIESRFVQGQLLDTSLGVTLDPQLSRLRYPPDYIRLLDCRSDGSYWTDRTTGLPAAGEAAELKRRPFDVTMERINGLWLVSEFNLVPGRC
jgi:hypothetical protein